MPLTAQQADTILEMLGEYETHLHALLTPRDDIYALLRIDATINNDNATQRVLTAAKQQARDAAQALVDFLGE